VAANQNKDHELDHLDLLERHRYQVLPPVEQTRLLENPDQLYQSQQPNQPHHLQAVRFLKIACDHVIGHDGNDVQPKPKPEIVLADPVVIPDQGSAPSRSLLDLEKEM